MVTLPLSAKEIWLFAAEFDPRWKGVDGVALLSGWAVETTRSVNSLCSQLVEHRDHLRSIMECIADCAVDRDQEERKAEVYKHLSDLVDCLTASAAALGGK